MSKAIIVEQYGGPSAMKWREVDPGRPKKGQVLINQTAVGLNFIDIYHRIGLYPVPLPFTPGVEGVGVVSKTGSGVTGFKPGDRVGYITPPPGSYAEQRIYNAGHLIKLPRDIPDEIAAASLLQGLTVQTLLTQVATVKAGDTILIHAAAGGIGLIMCQWARHIGATVIGTVGSRAKAGLARAHGCDHAIVYTEQDFVQRVRRITKGRGVDVVYDSVGKDTLAGSLKCLRPRGLLASFGQSSGAPDPLPLSELSNRGSLFVTRAGVYNYLTDGPALNKAARDLFKLIRAGTIRIELNQRYALKDAARAHRDLAARKTTGSTVLTI